MPVLHITDLFNPPGDPDDHFDLLALLAIKDLEICGVVIDHTVGRGMPGLATVRKAAKLCRRPEIPSAAGLRERLTSERDDGRGRPREEQAAIELILSSLKGCPDGLMSFTVVGSLRDLAAAYNREPDLFHAKTKRVLLNAGDSSGEVGPRDWNTSLDLAAWQRVVKSGLPIDWFPCNPSKGRGRLNPHVTYWSFTQDEFLAACAPAVREFFDTEGIASIAPVKRHMWSPVSFLEAARAAGCPGLPPTMSYTMKPATIRLDQDGTARWSLTADGAARIFTIIDPACYEKEMRNFLAGLYTRIG